MEFSAGSTESNAMRKARSALGEPTLDGWTVLETTRAVYYADLTLAELAEKTFYDSPPDAPAVAMACVDLRRAQSN